MTAEALAWQRLLSMPETRREALRRAVERAERRLRLLHRVRAGARPVPHPIALTPFVIPGRLLPTFSKLAASVHRFQAKAPELYRAGALNFRDLCPLDATTEAWLIEYGRPESDRDLVIRLDVGLAGNGAPVLYETNSVAIAGLFNHTIGVRILRRIVFPRLFAPGELRGLQDPPDLLAFLYRWITAGTRRLGHSTRKRSGVAFVESAGPLDGYSELPEIARYFEANGLRASCGSPEQLRLTPRGVLLKGMPVDLVYRDLQFEDLGVPPRSGARLAGFVELLKRQAMVPGFAGEFDQKGLLETLTSEAYRRFFSAREAGILKACVPWTRVLLARRTEGPDGTRIDLPEFARREKDRLVIKPNRGSGGEGILFGSEVTPSRWERAIDRALREKSRWVVQARVPAARRPMAYLQNGEIHFAPCAFSLGLFYARDHLGFHCRISRFETVNVGRGGALACVFVARQPFRHPGFARC